MFGRAPSEPLRPLDDKTRKRLERLRDMIFLRFGGTGVWEAIQTAVDLTNPVIAYPVRSLTTFSTSKSGGAVFGNALILRPLTTVKELAYIVHPEVGRHFMYAEAEDGRRVAEDDPVGPPGSKPILRFVTAAKVTDGSAEAASVERKACISTARDKSRLAGGAAAGTDADE